MNTSITKSNNEQLAYDESQINTVPPNISTNNRVNEMHNIHMANIQHEQQQIGTKRTTKDTNVILYIYNCIYLYIRSFKTLVNLFFFFSFFFR